MTHIPEVQPQPNQPNRIDALCDGTASIYCHDNDDITRLLRGVQVTTADGTVTLPVSSTGDHRIICEVPEGTETINTANPVELVYSRGDIDGIDGDIIRVRFGTPEQTPLKDEIVTIRRKDQPPLVAVVDTIEGTTVSCYAMGDTKGTKIDDLAEAKGQPLTYPVGMNLGRVTDALGNPIDGLGPLQVAHRWPLRRKAPEFREQRREAEPFETGIKIIDAMFPLFKGGKFGVVGGAGVGKTIIITEWMNRISSIKQGARKGCSVFAGVGERTRELTQLALDIRDANVLDAVQIIIAAMDQPAGMRLNGALGAVTTGEYYRDEEGMDVLLFIDNLFRFSLAEAELMLTMGKRPSEGGYSATLSSALSMLEERITPTQHGSITAMQAIYVPRDNFADPAVVAASKHLDGTLILSRDIADLGRYPAIDLLASSSHLLERRHIGDRHYEIAQQVISALQKRKDLTDFINLFGIEELDAATRLQVERADKLLAFFTQRFYVAKQFTGEEGTHVSLEDTLRGIEAILNVNGEFDDYELDDYPVEAFMNIGGIEDVYKHAKVRR
jgi:F-type H+/Na+-transporting ATPase subunit beta